MTVDEQNIHESLAAVRAARMRLAAASHIPASRHLAFAVLTGGLVATPALPVVARAVAVGALLCLVPLVIAWDRRRDGMFVNGYRAGATGPLTVALMLLMLGMFAMSSYAAISEGSVAAPLALGASAVVVGYICSVRWQRIYRDELNGAA